MGIMGAFSLALLLYVPLALVRGFVLAKLWTWHAVSVFDVPDVSTVQAAALALLVSLLTMQMKGDESSGDALQQVVTNTIMVVLSSGLCLLFGWIFALWLGVA